MEAWNGTLAHAAVKYRVVGRLPPPIIRTAVSEQRVGGRAALAYNRDVSSYRAAEDGEEGLEGALDGAEALGDEVAPLKDLPK